MPNAKEFGKRLTALRKRQGLSQQQLASKMIVSRSAVSMWEQGSRLPDIMMLARLALCLDADEHALMDAVRDGAAPEHVLVVEDVPALLRGTVRMVRDALPDAAVAGFENGVDALAYAGVNRVEIAFLDIELDGRMNGVALAKRLKALNRRVNIIFLTAFGEYTQDAHDLYSSGYLRKPITAERIREALDNLRFPMRRAGR